MGGRRVYEPWSEEELRILRDLRRIAADSRESLKAAAARLLPHRTYTQVKLRIARPLDRVGQYWTPKEKAILRRSYRDEEIETLLELLPTRSWNAVKKHAAGLGLARRTRRCQVERDFFERPTPENSCWAGLLAADGCLMATSKVKLTLAKRDELALHRFAKACGYTGTIHHYDARNQSGKSYPAASLVVEDVAEWHRDLAANFSITPRKTATLRPPKGLPNECVRPFIVGLINGDGSIRRYGARVCGIELCGTEAILRWVSDQIEHGVGVVAPTLKPLRGTWLLTYGGEDARKVFRWLEGIRGTYSFPRKWRP